VLFTPGSREHGTASDILLSDDGDGETLSLNKIDKNRLCSNLLAHTHHTHIL
jgi:hypothetical protein